MGIYGGTIVDAEEKKLKETQKQLDDVVAKYDEDEPSIQPGIEEKEPSLLDEIYQVLYLETPIVVIIVAIGLVLGYFEGWGIIER